MKRMGLLGIVAVAHAIAATNALACPFCRDALFAPAEAAVQRAAANGYLVSIVTLIGVPLLLVAGMVVWIVRSARAHQHQRPSIR